MMIIIFIILFLPTQPPTSQPWAEAVAHLGNLGPKHRELES